MEKLSVIVLNFKENSAIGDLISYFNSKFIDCEIMVASSKDHSLQNADEYIFKVCNEEKALNTLIPLVKNDKLLIIREFKDFSNFNKLVNAVQDENQISVFSKQKKQSKLLKKFMSFLFGYNLYNGSIAQICFGKNPLELLKSFDNCSMYTKIDKWVGYEVKEVECENIIKMKFKAKRKNNFIKLAIFSFTFVTPILLWSFVKYVQKTIWLKALCSFIILLSLLLIGIEISIIFAKKFVGDNEYDKIDFVKGEK